MKESIKIILNQFKKEYITEDEAIILLDDLYDKNTIINNPINPSPIYPFTWPQVTYDTGFPKYEVTCKTIK